MRLIGFFHSAARASELLGVVATGLLLECGRLAKHLVRLVNYKVSRALRKF